jgi:hypothetical protein
MAEQFDRAKFKDIVHYVCANCDGDQLGAVKLNKVLYFSDMLHFAFYGRSLTGATYRKRKLGPTADYILPALRELESEGRISVSDSFYFGYLKKEYRSLQAPDTNRFNAGQLDLLSDIIDFVCKNNTARTISEFSHNRAWELAEIGAPIPYHSAFHLFPSEVSDEAIKWAGGEVERLETETARRSSVDCRSFADFRSRVFEARGEDTGAV